MRDRKCDGIIASLLWLSVAVHAVCIASCGAYVHKEPHRPGVYRDDGRRIHRLPSWEKFPPEKVEREA